MQKGCKIAEEKGSRQALQQRLGGNPEVEVPGLVESSRLAAAEMISQLGRAAAEALLGASARSVAGLRRQGRRGKGKGVEAPIPALEAINGREGAGRRIWGILRGVSSRSCGEVIDEMAGTAGVSRAGAGREFIRRSSRQLKRLAGRRFGDAGLLAAFIDGIGFVGRQAICAAGRPRLFAAGASAALGRSVEEAFGAGRFAQRCRMCEPQRVRCRLPKKLAAEVRSEMGLPCRLPCRKGATQSRKEGLEQPPAVSRLGLPFCLRRCLGTARALLWLEAPGRSRWIPGRRGLWMLEASLQESRPPQPDPLESARNQ